MSLSSLLPAVGPAVILLDLDGTLVDSVGDLHLALANSFQQCAMDAPTLEQTRSWIGNGAPKLVARAAAHALVCEEADIDRTLFDSLLNAFFERYQSVSGQGTTLYPDVLEVLAYWQSLGHKMACVTNKPERFVAPILQALALEPYISAVVGGDTLAVRKPDPAPLRYACEQLQLPLSTAVMVGDSRNDVEAARAAGIPVACVSYGYNHGGSIADSKPDLLVDSFLALR
ncbi:MAG: phosphoglycolate phosphatase [Spongiibacteraceae bacterium]